MKFQQALAFLLLHPDYSSAWVLPTPRAQGQRGSNRQWQPLSAASNYNEESISEFLNSNELEMMLGDQEMTSPTQEMGTTTTAAQVRSSRYRVALPSHQGDQSTIILASAVAASPTEEATTLASAATAETSTETTTATDSEADPYASAFDSQMEKMQSYAERVEDANQGSALTEKFKSMDLQDIISTLIIPSIALFAAGRWAFNRVSSRVVENTDSILDAFAREMIYHDGDFDEMKLCYNDYSRKLLILGPTRTETMLKMYLEVYAKKKTVSPQSIVTLSYVFTLAKLSEEKAADVLVKLCRQMGPNKISSAGKLLFLGSRILKSPDGRKALEPIKDMIKATYRDEAVAETLVDTSQQYVPLLILILTLPGLLLTFSFSIFFSLWLRRLGHFFNNFWFKQSYC